ncbi:MAG: TolC family protein [Chitinophagales bacterium]|nr:TolC family protein [Bacteroidota bacterium]
MAYKLKMFLIALLVPFALFAQSQPFSLQEAMEYGLKNNAQIQSAELDVQDAQITVNNRIASGLPQVDASIDYQNFFKLPTSLIPAEFFGGEPGQFIPVQFGTEQNMTAQISASQLLFNGAWLVGISAAKEYAALVQKQSRLAETEVKKNVETAYYSVLIAKEFEKLLQKNIDNLNAVLFEVSEMQKQGFVESIDVDRLTMSKITLAGQLENATRQSQMATNFLKYSMGIDMATNIELTDTLGSITEVNMSGTNYLSRPEFSILQSTVTLNELNVKVNKAMYLPTLVAYGSYSQNAQRNSFNFLDGDEEWFETGLFGLTLSIPVFSGMERRTGVQAAEIALQKAQLQQQNATQGILLEVEKAKTDYLNAENDFNVQKQNIELAQRIYNTALIKYREGVGSSLELNNAESTLYQAQGNYISAMFALLNAKTALNKSLGYY